jgi:D-alanyl-D-alanine carboxypeptidase/D-alanyl-D-alanine-endopeptidase (penicillin-binding protein 4)
VTRQMPQRSTLILMVVVLGASSVAALGGMATAPALVGSPVGNTMSWRSGSTPSAPPDVLGEATETAPIPSGPVLSTVLGPYVGAPGLGNHNAVSVVDVNSGQALYGLAADASMIPASVTKLVTATTVLATRGPAYRIETRAVAGPNPGDVVLVGGGDPTLSIDANGSYPEAARLDDLAAQVRAALGGTAPTRVIFDDSLFSGPTTGPGWDTDDTTGGYGSPITALMTNGARVDPSRNRGGAARFSQPDVAAAQAFAHLLGLPPSAVVAGTAASGAKALGKVQSAPLVRIIETMLAESDNVVAEMMARQVAIARGQPASFAGEAVAMRAVLEDLGISVTGYGLADGSGLSRQGRLSAGLLTSLLTVDAGDKHAELHGVFTGLPVGGYSGTLAARFRGAAVAGTVRAKTGTLTGISAIAGLVTDADGRILAFAAIADNNPGTGGAQQALDRIVTAVASCGCR